MEMIDELIQVAVHLWARGVLKAHKEVYGLEGIEVISAVVSNDGYAAMLCETMFFNSEVR